jgi:predicted TIM-barrel fold metal-dependent hydrolase
MDSEPGYLRIATEEAFAPPELITLWRSMLEDGTCDDPGFLSLPGFYLRNTAERPAAILARLQDLGERRIADMDAAGIDRQIISLTCPGTQILDRDRGVAMATLETGLHLLRIITAGVFDHFPRLRLVVGHLGEALPFWLYRIDYMHAATVRAGRYESMKPIQRRPSEYLRENVWLTTSGMAWVPAIMFCRDVLGPDRVMYAMDYPYEYTPGEVTIQDALPVDAAAKKAFFQGIAEQVFSLA